MDIETSFNNLIEEFELQGIRREDQEDILLSLAQAVHTQFLLDVQEIIGNENFAAIEQSLAMGEAFYETTLKHVLPNYDDVFQAARKKVVAAYKAAATPVLN